METVCNIDLSYIRPEDKERFENIEEMREEVAGFLATLKDFIVGLLGILITAEDARASASTAHSIGNFGVFSYSQRLTPRPLQPLRVETENPNPLPSFK